MADTQITTASGVSTTLPEPATPRSTTSTTPKLRDSCLACSSSKVRCPREKPACSRCVKRQVQCEYLKSRRAGRKHDTLDCYIGRGSAPTVTTAPDATPEPLPTPNSSSAPSISTILPTTTFKTSQIYISSPHSLGTEPSPEPTISIDALQSYPSLVSPEGHGMHDSLEPFMSFSVMDEHDTDMILNDILDFTSTFDNSDGSKNDYLFGFAPSLEVLPVGTFSEPGDTYAPTSLPQSQPKKPTAITSPEVGEKDTDSSCICLAQVLRLMKQLFPRPSSSFAPSAAKVGDSNAHDPSVSVIIERNRDSIDAIGAILACSCSTDANMLAVTAHIVFKVLGWYAIVARGTSSSRDNGGDIDNSSCGSSSGGYPGNSAGRLTTAASLPYQGADHNSCRMAAQLVLRELYRVQRLVTELAVKLKAMSQDATELLPFSGTILDSLGADLKNKLKILSLEIVQSLRNN